MHKPSKSIGGNNLNNLIESSKTTTQQDNADDNNNNYGLLKKFKIEKKIKTVNTHIHKYSVKSRAGNNCDGTRKTNQDSYIAKPNLINYDDYSAFGVFDGHGII